jgi:predicted amidohydrolase YtcJ
MTALVIRHCEVEGRLLDVRCVGGRVDEMRAGVSIDSDDLVVDGGGGAVIPGLHDHHIHLLATAAAARSVVVGPPDVRSHDELATALRDADVTLGPGEWLRAVGYHESVAGELDRWLLDAIVPNRAVRLQHRSGALWVLNSEACRRIGVDGLTTHPMEVNGDGQVTGRIFRGDEWLRARLPVDGSAGLEALGRRLAGFGVTGVTDATPTEDPSSLHLLASSALPQRLQVMGGPALAGMPIEPPLVAGPVKVMVPDHALPSLDKLAQSIQIAHDAGRPAALHLVTRAALVLALAAWEEARPRPGDRIEHGSVIPEELIPTIARMGLRVVTQPNFVAERGDDYLREVEEADLPDLYRCGSLLARGVPVAAGSDAPFGATDPWVGIKAAIERRSRSGTGLGSSERITAEAALGLYLSPLDDPGGPPRRVGPGEPADLVLLRAPLAEALRDPGRELVHVTVINGVLEPG